MSRKWGGIEFRICFSNHVTEVRASQVAQWWRIACQCSRCGFNSWIRKIPWRRKWQPAPVFLPEKSHGQRNLEGYSLWDWEELDMTERLSMHALMQRRWLGRKGSLGSELGVSDCGESAITHIPKGNQAEGTACSHPYSFSKYLFNNLSMAGTTLGDEIQRWQDTTPALKLLIFGELQLAFLSGKGYSKKKREQHMKRLKDVNYPDTSWNCEQYILASKQYSRMNSESSSHWLGHQWLCTLC